MTLRSTHVNHHPLALSRDPGKKRGKGGSPLFSPLLCLPFLQSRRLRQSPAAPAAVRQRAQRRLPCTRAA